ncbi:MAG: divalent-cation tolerance protein CutA [Candidatus Hodarchaeota archaeon]
MYIVVLITTPNPNEAEIIGKTLVERKLAACVNIIPKIRSIFWWEGKIEESSEALIIAKSKSDLMKEIQETVKEKHSYDVPEIIALSVESGLPQYCKWIDESVR